MPLSIKHCNIFSYFDVIETMDSRQALINVLRDLQNNLQVILHLSQQSDSAPLEERFYRWIREPFPLNLEEGAPIMSTSHQSFQETANVVHRFAQVVADQIASGQTVDGCHTRLTRLRAEKEKMENKLRQLTLTQEQEKASQNFELHSRLELIQDLKARLQQTKERTTSCLRLAKECGEAARKEWEINNQKPLEEQRIHYELLNAQLTTILKENANTEEHLVKCCEEQKREIETVTLQMNEDIRQRQEEVEQLRREVSGECAQLQEIENALTAVTIEYDEIIKQKHKEAEEKIRRRTEARLRERAAIRIQRWFRLYLLRTIKLRKKRKKAKRKVTKEVKREPVEENNQIKLQPPQFDSHYEDMSGENRTAVAVSVSRKSAIVRKSVSSEPTNSTTEETSLPLASETAPLLSGDTLSTKTNSKSKKPVSAIQSITVKKNKFTAKTITVEQEVKPNPVVSLNRSSQTDNRVPRSKQTFR